MREIILSNRRSHGPGIALYKRLARINDDTYYSKLLSGKKDVLLFYGLMQFQATGDLSTGMQ